MNKHLLKTRLNSIQHYNDELKRLEAATKETVSTKQDLVNSLSEFFPFESGQIIMKGDTVRKFIRFDGVTEHHLQGIYFNITTKRPGRWGFESEESDSINIESLSEWKVISSPKPEEL